MTLDDTRRAGPPALAEPSSGSADDGSHPHFHYHGGHRHAHIHRHVDERRMSLEGEPHAHSNLTFLKPHHRP